MSHKDIEKQILENNEFSIKQTFGHPFIDFKISHVGETFENLINQGNTFLPSLNSLFHNFKSLHYDQFKNQQVTDAAIFGRVARMWASLVREWHAYYLLLHIGKKFELDRTDILRNDELDTKKGIDIYLKNKRDKEKSIKLDILQSTKKAAYFRNIKDTIRVKDKDIPGIKAKIQLGKNKKTTKELKGWYLLDNDYAERIITYFITNK